MYSDKLKDRYIDSYRQVDRYNSIDGQKNRFQMNLNMAMKHYKELILYSGKQIGKEIDRYNSIDVQIDRKTDLR